MKANKAKGRAAGTGRPWKTNYGEQDHSMSLRRNVNPNRAQRRRRGFLRTR